MCKKFIYSFVLVLGCLCILNSTASADIVTLTASDDMGTSSFNSAGKWSDGLAPSAGNDYVVDGYRLRTPADDGSYTFAGDSLTVTNSGEASSVIGLSYKGSGTTATITVDDLILDAGHINHISSSADIFNLYGNITVASDSLIYAKQGPISIYSSISGSSQITNPGDDGEGRVLTFYSSANTFTGSIVNNGRFVLADDALLNFVIGASGVNNSVSGTGPQTDFNGDFSFDLSGAGTTLGDSWTIANASTQSFGSTFTVVGFFDNDGTNWIKNANGTTYQFSESTGILSVIPPKAYNPTPANGGSITTTSTLLEWEPSPDADAHDVYVGTDYGEVNDANRDNNGNMIFYEEDHDVSNFLVYSLVPGETYYWRIDEVSGTDVWKGDVWSFYVAAAGPSPSLIHRYSFIDGDTVAVDDVGGKDGSLIGTAALSGNQLVLDGDGHVELPSDVLDAGLTSVTIEGWFELSGSDYWQRLFDFGETVDSNGGNCMFYAPSAEGRFVIATNGIPSWETGEDLVNGGTVSVDTPTHIVCVFDEVGPETKIYVNGSLADSNATGMSLSGVARDNAYIGESSYPGDPNFVGTINEFRIYNKALSFPEIVASYYAGPDVYRATNPDPCDGASNMPRNVTLSWDPGTFAGTHNVYFDPNKAKVVEANSTNYSSLLHYSIGQEPNSYSVTNLPAGETYYWRVDEVNDANIWRGNIWSFTVYSVKASNLYPYDDKICVLLDAELSWDKGTESTQSKVYFGDTSGDLELKQTITHTGETRYSYSLTNLTLSNGTDYYWRIDEYNDNDACTWPGDEFHFTTIPIITPPGGGLVGWWLFDEGQDNAIDWSGLGQHGTIYGGAESVEGYDEDGISLDGDDDHVELPIGNTISTLTSCTITTWVNFSAAYGPFQRIFDFGNDENEYMFMTPRYGWTDGPLRFGITLTSWNGDPGEFAVANPDGALATGWHHVAVAINADYPDITLFLDGVAVDNQPTDVLPSDLGVTVNNWLGKSQYPADANFNGILDDFRIYDFAMTEEDLKTVMASKEATLPEPANNATGVDRNPVLSWQPGRYAADTAGHKLYYSTDLDDVSGRIGDPVVLDDPTYTIPAPNAPYESLQTVFWVVDEVNDSHPDQIWPGNIWTFTIKDYSVIDDFELYTDTGKSEPPPEDTLKSVWVDGNYAFDFTYQTPGTSGSLVQLNTDTDDGAPSYTHYVPGDEDIAQSGAQSMKFYYDNDGTVTWEVDLYDGYPPDLYTYTPTPDTYLSEAYAAIDDAAQTDPDLDSLDLLRDFSGYNVLGLSFYGDPNNTTNNAGLYVGLKDADGTLYTIAHPNPTQLTEASWHDWYVKLSEFQDNGIDLANIVRIYIGFGNKSSPASGGSGVVFFDDIQFFTGVCIPDSLSGDFDDDCVIDNRDLEIFTYGFPGQMPTMPTPIINLSAASLSTGPLSSWSNSSGSGGGTFIDVNATDGNEPVVETVAGKKCVTFDNLDMLVWDQNAPATLTSDTNEADDFTVICEVYNPQIADEEILLTWAQRGGPAGTTAGLGFGSNAAWGAVIHWNAGDQYPDMGFDRGVPAAGQWHIIGVTYDGTTEALAVDGAIHNLEDKDLVVYADQPVTIGGPYEVPAEPNDAYIRDTFVPSYGIYPYGGSVASIKVYGEAIPPGDLAILTASLASLSNAETDVKPDGKIDFGDLAVMGYKWMEDPYLFGEDY